MTAAERKALIALSQQDTGDPRLNEMLRSVVEEKILQGMLGSK